MTPASVRFPDAGSRTMVDIAGTVFAARILVRNRDGSATIALDGIDPPDNQRIVPIVDLADCTPLTAADRVQLRLLAGLDFKGRADDKCRDRLIALRLRAAHARILGRIDRAARGLHHPRTSFRPDQQVAA